MFCCGNTPRPPQSVKKGTNTLRCPAAASAGARGQGGRGVTHSAQLAEHLLMRVLPHSRFLQHAVVIVGMISAASERHAELSTLTGGGGGPPEGRAGHWPAAVRRAEEKSWSRPRSEPSHSRTSGASSEPQRPAQKPRSARDTPAQATAASKSCASGQLPPEPAPVARSHTCAKESSWSCSAAPNELATAPEQRFPDRSNGQSRQQPQPKPAAAALDWIDAKTSVNSSAHEAAPAPAWSMQVCHDSEPLSPVMPNSA